MEEHRTLLKDVFGESSGSEGDELQKRHFQFEDPNDDGARSNSVFRKNPSWDRFGEINGLCLCRDFLSPERQSSLLLSIKKEGWFSEASHNQAMRFGDLPAWATELSNLIREVVHCGDNVPESVDTAACNDDKVACLFPSNLLWREPFFDQLIVNIYQPGNLCTC